MRYFIFTFIIWFISGSECRNKVDTGDSSNNESNGHVVIENGDRVIVDSGIRVIEKCNGFMELCDLDLTQITLPGSHNSGAGFAGPLKFHTSAGQVPASSCANRYQMKSIYDQLVLGIRYFDIQTCWG